MKSTIMNGNTVSVPVQMANTSQNDLTDTIITGVINDNNKNIGHSNIDIMTELSSVNRYTEHEEYTTGEYYFYLHIFYFETI